MKSDLYGLPGLRTLRNVAVAHAFFWTIIGILPVISVALLWQERSIWWVLLVIAVVAGISGVLQKIMWDSLGSTAFKLDISLWPLIYKKMNRAFAILVTGSLVAATIAVLVGLSESNSVPLTVAYPVIFCILLLPLLMEMVKNVYRFNSELQSKSAMVKKFRKALARSVAGPDELSRLTNSINVFAGDEPGSPTPDQRGLRVIGLGSNNFHDKNQFKWVQAFEQHHRQIHNEAQEIATSKAQAYKPYDYPGVSPTNWTVIPIYAEGKFTEDANLCPTLMSLLETIPGHPNYREIVFSKLEPGGRIKPHRDAGNYYLTLHLALDTPAQAWMRVGGEKTSWEDGKAIVFDTAFEHEVLNESERSRLVLIVDFPHPALTEAELPFLA